jgi:hypothetical protein
MTTTDDSEQRAGIPRPDGADGSPVTPDQMRATIYSNRYDSELIHTALTHGEIRGMQGEDIFTVLAYRGLRALEDLHVQHQKCKEQITRLEATIEHQKGVIAQLQAKLGVST